MRDFFSPFADVSHVVKVLNQEKLFLTERIYGSPNSCCSGGGATTKSPKKRCLEQCQLFFLLRFDVLYILQGHMGHYANHFEERYRWQFVEEFT